MPFGAYKGPPEPSEEVTSNSRSNQNNHEQNLRVSTYPVIAVEFCIEVLIWFVDDCINLPKFFYSIRDMP